MPLDNQLGGAGPSPGTVTNVSSAPTLIIKPGGSTTDGHIVYFTETTYGVSAAFTVDDLLFTAQGVQSLADEYAAAIQVIGEQTPVIAISYAQDLNAAGDLIDVLIVTVQSTSGNSTDNVEIPLLQSNQNSQVNKVLAAGTNLDAIEAIGA